MFCFQCEQTAGGKGCTSTAGVCGKKAETAFLQDRLTGALISLAQTVNGHRVSDMKEISKLIREGLFMTVTNVCFDDRALDDMTERVDEIKSDVFAESGVLYSDHDMTGIWESDEDIRSLKSLILFGLRGMAAYACHAAVLKRWDDDIDAFFITALAALGENCGKNRLMELVLETGRMNLKCMAMLDRANTGTFGTPRPVPVEMRVKKGPFIVVTGHDLRDLKLLLEQTDGKGINIYTHGEMLPAHAYPALNRYRHLSGNYGTAWQRQKIEFDELPAPVLFTTNCLMPPGVAYADRVFTTGSVYFPDTVHIGDEKDFSPLIDKAFELGGWKEDRGFQGINGGDRYVTGFGHGAVLEHRDRILKAVRTGEISHIFLVGGCDGARPGRNYYTEFVKQTPRDSIIFTLACGKYRFNDLDLGYVAGLPRIMDMGQCNDAFSAIEVITALAEALECDVNELPLSVVLSWYEQKAVAVLLTLLYLGVKNIILGPSLPAFISPGILRVLVERYGIAAITMPEYDLAHIFGSELRK